MISVIENPPTNKNPTRRSAPRMIEVVAIEQPHPEIKRVLFSGESLRGFPTDKNGSHIKLFFPQAHQAEPRLPTLGANGPLWPEKSEKPITRTYSVRYYDALRNVIAVDFAWHGKPSDNITSGPAYTWLAQLKGGERIGLAGPGGPDPLIAPARDQICVLDTSAFGAMWAITEVPANTRRHLFIVANHPVSFSHAPQHLQYYQPSRYPTPHDMYAALLADLRHYLVRHHFMPDADISGFVAGENQLVLSVRDQLIASLRLTKQRLYAIPYWRLGQNEESYHQTRHSIMDEEY